MGIMAPTKCLFIYFFSKKKKEKKKLIFKKIKSDTSRVENNSKMT